MEKVPLFTNKGGLDRFKGINAMRKVTAKGEPKINLGIVSDEYPVIQPLEKFGVFQKFADEGLLEFVRGGVYNDGSRIYLEARMPNPIIINAEVGDVVERRITFYSSYDRSLSNEFGNRPLRLVCLNGMTTLGKNFATRYRNTKNVLDRTEEISNVLSASMDEYKQYEEFIRATTQTREFSESEVSKFIELALPSTREDKTPTLIVNRRLELEEAIHTAIGQDVIPEMNAYKLLQGALAWTQHLTSPKAKNPEEYREFGSGARFNTNIIGIVQDILKNDHILS